MAMVAGWLEAGADYRDSRLRSPAAREIRAKKHCNVQLHHANISND